MNPMRTTILIMIAAGVAEAGFAATIRVPAMAPTIQAGINAASEGDTVIVAPGVYRGEGNKRISFYGRNLVLRSEAGPYTTIIDVEGHLEPDQAFRIEHGETSATIIDGFTIRGGYLESAGGAAMLIGFSSPTVRNCVFSNNVVGGPFYDLYGGAIYVGSGSPTFTACVFTGNRAWFSGEPPGRAASGGALYCSSASLRLAYCKFEANEARGVGGSGDGGAIFAGTSSSLELISCAFLNNGADIGGGALCLSGSNGIVEDTIFSFNRTGNWGDGGAIFAAGSWSSLHITNSTFIGNAASRGGGIWTEGQSVLIESTILAFSERGAAIRCYTSGEPIQLGCSDLFGNVGGDWAEPCLATQFGMRGNFSADPLFCDWQDGDVALHANSPCAPAQAPPGCGLIGAVDVACGVTAIGEEAVTSEPRYLQVRSNPTRGRAEFLVSPRLDQVLQIYDVGGHLVDEIRLTTDKSRVMWSPQTVSAGVYFAVLSRSSGRSVVKFVVLQ